MTQPDSTLTPRFETSTPMTLAGVVEHYNGNDMSGIPAQWQRFGQHLGHIPNQVGNASYGASFNSDSSNNMEYMSGVQVSSSDGLMNGFATLDIPKQRYAIFTQTGNISTIRNTFDAIWNQWLPSSKLKTVRGVTLERYGPEYDPRSGNGGFEIWIPVEG